MYIENYVTITTHIVMLYRCLNYLLGRSVVRLTILFKLLCRRNFLCINLSRDYNCV